jgi:hypothetical protein
MCEQETWRGVRRLRTQLTAHAGQLLPWLIVTLTQNRGYDRKADNESAQNDGCLYWDGENEDKRDEYQSESLTVRKRGTYCNSHYLSESVYFTQ